MNIYKHILTETEKKIIENHFIHNGHNSKKDFEELTLNIVNKYAANPFNLKHKWRKPAKKDIDYSINLIWDEETNTTAMMYCFSHSNFFLSNAKWRQFKTFNGDINIQNKNGQTALMLLSKELQINNITYHVDSFIASLLDKPLGFDLTIRDKDNKTFHMYFFERYAEQVPSDKSLRNIMYSFISKIDNLNKILLHWINTAKTENREQNLFVAQTILSVTSFIKSGLSKNKKNGKATNSWLDNISQMEKIGQSLELEATMEINLATNKRNKM
jgi:hypothetical protein